MSLLTNFHCVWQFFLGIIARFFYSSNSFIFFNILYGCCASSFTSYICVLLHQPTKFCYYFTNSNYNVTEESLFCRNVFIGALYLFLHKWPLKHQHYINATFPKSWNIMKYWKTSSKVIFLSTFRTNKILCYPSGKVQYINLSIIR